MGDQSQAIIFSLGDQYPIERVTMIHGQRSDRSCIRDSDGQLFKTLRLHLLGKIIGYFQFAQVGFYRHFPDRRSTYENKIFSMGNRLTGWSGKFRRIGQPPEQHVRIEKEIQGCFLGAVSATRCPND